MRAKRLPAVHPCAYACREVACSTFIQSCLQRSSLQCICVLMPAQRSPAVHLFSAVREIACSTVIWSCLAMSGPFLAMPFPIRACLALLVRPSGHAKINGNAYTHVQISCMNSGVGSLTHLLACCSLAAGLLQHSDVPHTLSCPAKCSDTYPNQTCHGYCRSSGRRYGS